MKIDTGVFVYDLHRMPALARAAEDMGFDALWTVETAHEPFLPLALAAEHSERLTLGTAIAVAFPRSPTILAHVSWDLARFSRGRFILGLGTQVKGHNERRFGIQWERPIAKMRDVILAIRALWNCWQNQTRLNFQGSFYKLTLMTPFFNPGPHEYPNIPIYIAGVNGRTCRLAGELCEGLHAHPLNSSLYLREVVLPNIHHGLAKSGRPRANFEISGSLFVIPTDGAYSPERYEAEVREQIAFYASTPAYHAVFEIHGWKGVADQLSRMAAQGKWQEMPGLITDEMLDAFSTRGSFAELPEKILKKYDGLLDRVSYYFGFKPGENDFGWRQTIAGFKV
ncbi:MAG TPA: TIGR03617 family F420-dependent LLM class oxidoreductase [Terriglobales bacterium]|nr:TIGR03617 family F420-dependent LLM class oxidoreductase [Terriglobales bacterium]